MDKIPAKIQKLIKKYINALEKNNVPIRQAVLFGSYARGHAHDWSDIDIALVSDAFEGTRFRDRNKIRKITVGISSDLSPLPYRTNDFTPDDPFVKEILKTGINIL